MELDYSVDDAILEVPGDYLEISLHAITGQRHAKTMQLSGIISSRCLVLLILEVSTIL